MNKWITFNCVGCMRRKEALTLLFTYLKTRIMK